MGDSIVKHIRGYEISQRVENSKVFVKASVVQSRGAWRTAYSLH